MNCVGVGKQPEQLSFVHIVVSVERRSNRMLMQSSSLEVMKERMSVSAAEEERMCLSRAITCSLLTEMFKCNHEFKVVK